MNTDQHPKAITVMEKTIAEIHEATSINERTLIYIVGLLRAILTAAITGPAKMAME